MKIDHDINPNRQQLVVIKKAVIRLIEKKASLQNSNFPTNVRKVIANFLVKEWHWTFMLEPRVGRGSTLLQ